MDPVLKSQLDWVSKHEDRIVFWKNAIALGPRHFGTIARAWGRRDGWEQTDREEMWFVMGLLVGAVENLCDQLENGSSTRKPG